MERSAGTTDLAEAPVVGGQNPTETALAEVLAGVVRVDRVPVESHFFDDLGADSMVMAQFCARVRKRADLPSVSMKDIYRHPTIQSLAAAFADPIATLPTETSPTETLSARDLPVPAPTEPPHPAALEAAPPASTGQYVLCGTLQFLAFLGYCWLYVAIVTRGYQWVAAGTGGPDIYLRSVLFSVGLFVSICVLPIVAKWVLVGRWKRQQIPVWSLAYVRFWLVKTLVRTNPLARIMIGSPLYVVYLRALGARVGKGVAIFARAIPVCTDLLSIGDGTVVRKGASLSCYRAQAGLIETGSVTLGRNVVVAEATVLDIETSMGDGAQLGHASSLHPGQTVPAGERWHGSPAQRTDVDYRTVEPTDCRTLRRVLYSIWQLLGLTLVSLPLVFAGAAILAAEVPQVLALLDPADLSPADLAFYREALLASFVLTFGFIFVGLLLVVSVPRLLDLAIEPGKVYPLYGIRYSLHKAVVRLTNVKFFTYLFGDSSYIVYYLRVIGYNLNKVQQTGSNFGTDVVHESPYLSSVGTGTMVADGLSLNNADYSSTSFRLSPTAIGAHNFVGNHIAYPSQGKTGDNCLLATKVMVPIDGRIREGVGLLGSPSFEIPRSVFRDTSLEPGNAEELRRLLAAKNKHNLQTLALALLVRWMHVFVLTMLAMVATDLYRRFGLAALVAEFVASLLFTLAYFIFVERAATGFRRLRPQYCSIYDPRFWRHERFWKLATPKFEGLLTGTPFKNVMSRLLGVRIGKKVFDDGCFQPEKTLTIIGDYCTLNAGSVIQCHSQEDGAFKSDYSRIGTGCTIGVGALVHYGVTVGDGAVLAPDSFLMKGEQVPQHAHWGGNPAGEMQGSGADLRIRSDATALLPPVHEPRAVLGQHQRMGLPSNFEWVPPSGDSAAGAQPAATLEPSRSRLTPVRRGVGLAAVLFLLGSAVVYYREAPDFTTFVSTPSTQPATPGGLSSSTGPSPTSDLRRPTAAPTPKASGTSSPGPTGAAIEVQQPALSARPFQTVRIQGTYRGRAGTFLQLQRWEAGKWLAFPIPAKTDQAGRFTAYVDLAQPGRYRLRLLDTASGVTSKPFVLVIKS